MADKLVWILWAELRANGDVDGLETPTGLIPKYEDLARLFKEHLSRQYSEADYVEQFTIRIPENLAKLDRVETGEGCRRSADTLRHVRRRPRPYQSRSATARRLHLAV
jgi:GTP-dependent phosphoenolpyruvate carboxykinase